MDFDWNYLLGKFQPSQIVCNKKILLDRRYDEPVSIYSRFVGMTI